MESLQELAVECICDDITPYFKDLHDLPVPVLEQLLPALSPCQLLNLENTLGKGVDTSRAWRRLCQKLSYPIKRRQPWEPPHHVRQTKHYFRSQFLKHYMSTYLLPFLSRWPQDEELRPTERVFLTQSNHLSNCSAQHELGEFPPLTFESFLNHLCDVASYADEISVRPSALVHIVSHPHLIMSLQSNLQVLRIGCQMIGRDPVFLQIVKELLPSGNLHSLQLEFISLSSDHWNQLFYLCSGGLLCSSCSSKHSASSFDCSARKTSKCHKDSVICDCVKSSKQNDRDLSLGDSSLGDSCNLAANKHPVADQHLHRKEPVYKLGPRMGCQAPNDEMFRDDSEMNTKAVDWNIHEVQKSPGHDLQPHASVLSSQLSAEKNCVSSLNSLAEEQMHSDSQEIPVGVHDGIFSSAFLTASQPVALGRKDVCSESGFVSNVSDDSGSMEDEEPFYGYGGEQFTLAQKEPTGNSELDLFDEALASVSNHGNGGGDRLCGPSHKERACSRSDTSACMCMHTCGIKTLSLLSCESSPGAQEVLPVLASWLPCWSSLESLTLRVDAEKGFKAAADALLEKIRMGQLRSLMVRLVHNTYARQQFFWNVLQAAAACSCSDSVQPMKQFAFSCDLLIAEQHCFMPERDVSGVHSLCIWDTEIKDSWSVKCLAQHLAYNQCLRRFSMKRCEISATDVDMLISTVNGRGMGRLEQLELEEIDLSLASSSLSLLISNNQKLTTLTLSDCKLTAHHVSELTRVLKPLQHLHYLDLSRNCLCDSLVDFVPAIVFPGAPLKVLNIGNTNPSYDGWRQLMDSLLKTPVDSLPLLDSFTVPCLQWNPNILFNGSFLLLEKLRHIAVFVETEGDNHRSDYIAQM